MCINNEWKCMCENFLLPWGIFGATKPTTSHLISFVVAVPTKYFLSLFSHGDAHIFEKKETFFRLRRVVVVAFRRGSKNYSQYLFFHGRRRRDVLTIVIMAQLTCIVCVFASISHTFCMQHDECSYVEVTVSYMRRARCVAYSLEKLKSNFMTTTQCDDRN